MAPEGSHLNIRQLADALLWHLTSTEATQEKHAAADFSNTELETLESELIKAVSAIRSLRNARCPVNRIPSETLAVVFEILQKDFKDFRPSLQNSFMNTWLPLASFCRYWRETALKFSTLWSLIDLYRGCPAAAKAFLERTSTAPLRVFHAAHPPESDSAAKEDEILEAVGKESERFSEFHVVSYNMLRPAVWNFFQKPAPLLKALTVSMELSDPANTTLPPLFSDQTPSLEKLTIRYFSSWPGNHFSGLTHVFLHHQAESGRLSLSEFLDFLEASPELEELVVIDAGPQVESVTPEVPLPRRVISLEKLRVLEMGKWAGLRVAGAFLASLILSPNIEFLIWGKDMFAPEHDLSALFIPNTSFTDNLSELTGMRITHEHSDTKLISIKNSSFHVDGEFSSHQYVTLPRGKLKKVTELWVGSLPTEPTVEQWTQLLSAMPSLCSLVVFRLHPHRILSAIAPRGAESGTLCPDMQKLHVHHSEGASSLHLFLFVERLSSQGRPLQSLRMPKDSERDEEASTFKRYVSEVEFVDDATMDPIAKGMEVVWPTPSSLWS